MNSPYTIPRDVLHPMSVYGLKGRVLELGAKDDTQTPILFVYGMHTCLERVYTITQVLGEFGPVTTPDLPGFGGMEGLEHVEERPSLDNLADFLAAFIDQRFPDQETKITFVGMSLGFALLTRMLQRHPHLSSRVKLLVSLAGFTNIREARWSKATIVSMKYGAQLFKRQPFAFIFRWIFLQRLVISTIYTVQSRRHPKMRGLSREERKKMIDFEVYLWQANDVQTYFWTLYEISRIDLTRKHINLPVHQIAIKQDQYFRNSIVKRDMQKIFDEVTIHYAEMPNHAPTIIEDVEGASLFLPESVRAVLRKAGV